MNALPDPLKIQLQSSFGVLNTEIPEVQWMVVTDALFRPLYGKFAVMNSSVLHSAMYLIGGASAVKVQRAVFPSLNAGLGLRLFTTQATLRGQEQVYQASASIGVPGWAVAALWKVGLASRDFAQAAARLTTPDGLSSEDEAAFRQQVTEQVAPLRGRADDAFAAPNTAATGQRGALGHLHRGLGVRVGPHGLWRGLCHQVEALRSALRLKWEAADAALVHRQRQLHAVPFLP